MPSVLEALNDGDPARALAELDRLRERDAEPEAAGFYRALALSRSGRRTEALRAWSAELARHPGNSRAHLQLAELLLEQGQVQAAQQHVQTARRLDPDTPDGLLVAGKVHWKAGRDEEAQRLFRDHLSRNPAGPRSHEAHRGLALIATRRGQLVQADAETEAARRLQHMYETVASARRQLRDGGDPVEAWLAMADAYLSQYVAMEGHRPLLAQAEDVLDKVVERQPANVQALLHLAFVYAEQNRLTEAADAYRAVLVAAPGHPSARLELARLLRRGGGTQARAEAQQILSALVADEPPPFVLGPAQIELAGMVEALDPERALGLYHAYLTQFPEDPAGLGPTIRSLEARLGGR